MQVRDAASAAQKFQTRAVAAQGDYQAGVANAGARWQAGAEASEGAYTAGVQQAIAEGRFRKGVSKAGSQKYQDNATKLGPQRFQQGVQNAAPAYAKGVQPYLDAMRNASLTPRSSRGNNMTRIAEQIDLMRKTKQAQLG